MSWINEFFDWSMGKGTSQATSVINKTAKAAPTAKQSSIDEYNTSQFLSSNVEADLLRKKEATDALTQRTNIAGAAYGAALGGSNMNSLVNQSQQGRRSILGSF